MSEQSTRRLISREPWWATAPASGASDLSVEWGYLEHYEGGGFEFVQQRPTDAEILNRKSCRRAEIKDGKVIGTRATG